MLKGKRRAAGMPAAAGGQETETMVRLEEINGKNVREILKLKVGEDQKSFVAPNDISLIEAYIAVSHHGKAFPFGIYDGDIPVGFCMIGFGADDDWEDAPAVAENSYNLWRLMIDERYQGKGYGKAAMKLIMDYVRSGPCGPAEYCWLSYEPENVRAKALYAAFGFRETGGFDGGEAIAVLKLRDDDTGEGIAGRDSGKRDAAEQPERATSADAETVAELACELWPENTAEEMAAEYRVLLADEEAAVFLFRTEGQTAGFAQCQLRHDYVEGTDTSPVGYLEGIYVREAYRRKRVACRLLAACQDWAKEHGCAEFASDCELTNTGSQSFHQAVGFTEANRIVAYVRKL